MEHNIPLQLASILIVGVLAQWAAWRIRVPSILLLLATGLLVGPITRFLDPDKLFGTLMLPLVSLAVATILYEGGLNLKFRELQYVGGVFLLLTTVGVVISFGVTTLAARLVLGLEWPTATLLGAILVVTGPTVIQPILRHLRLRGRVGALLKWEGIIIDPIGAILAVFVFTAIQSTVLHEGIAAASLNLALTCMAGVMTGCVAAGVFILVLARYWIPDSLHNPVSLMLMLSAFTAANAMRHEAGLIAVTVMGMVLANQKRAAIRHVVEFKENLTVLLISCLFVVLASRLTLADLRGLGWEGFAFVGILIVIARPTSVLASCVGSTLSWQERCFLCCMAPRGIVAAAITSVFALNLVQGGYPQATAMVPVTFLVVFLTVLLYGVGAAPLAGWLGLIQANPQGVLFIGATSWVRALAKALQAEEIPVFLLDTDRENVQSARMMGLPCLLGSALAEDTREAIDYAGLGRMLAVTSNNEVNSLACLWYAEDFGRQEVYQLAQAATKEKARDAVAKEYRGRLLFGEGFTFSALHSWAGRQPTVKRTKLTNEFDYAAFQSEHGDTVLPVFIVRSDGTLQVRTDASPTVPKAGDVILSLVRDRGPAAAS